MVSGTGIGEEPGNHKKVFTDSRTDLEPRTFLIDTFIGATTKFVASLHPNFLTRILIGIRESFKMVNKFEEIKNAYASKFREHGVSSASMLMPKGRHEARFAIVADYLQTYEDPTILDYGCGLGFLHTYLEEEGISHHYLGIDIVPEFIESCNDRVGTTARFELIQPDEVLVDNFDFVYASGVFNLQTEPSEKKSLAYARERILKLFQITKKVMIIDFLSPDVDFQQENSQHIDYRMVLDWLVPASSRRWILRHDYLPYEYSLVVFKNDEVSRPDNVFVDSDDIPV